MANVLVVDHATLHRQVVSSVLSFAGHQVVEAKDSQEARRAIAGRPLDLLITDISLPDGTGLEIIDEARRSSGDLGVIICTDGSQEPYVQGIARMSGVPHVLVKPADPTQVLETVGTILGRSGERQTRSESLNLLLSNYAALARHHKDSNSQLTSLMEIELQLSSERDPQKLCLKFCHALRKIVNAEFAAVAIKASDGKGFLYYTSGPEGECDALLDLPEPSRGATGAMMETLTSIRANTKVDLAALDLLDLKVEVTSFLGAPIFTHAHTYGWLNLLNQSQASYFTEEHERLVLTFAAKLAVLLENARLFKHLQSHALSLEQEIDRRRKAEAEARILAAQQSVVSSLSQQALRGCPLNEFLGNTLTAVTGLLQVQYAQILQWLPSTQDLVCRAQIGEFPPPRSFEADSPEARALTSQEPVTVRLESGDADYPERDGDSSPLYCLSLPINGTTRTFGLLRLLAESDGAFASSASGFLDAVANVVGIALERNKLEESAASAREAERNMSRSIFEQAPIGIARIDNELRLLAINQAFAAAFSTSPQTVIGESLLSLLPALPSPDLQKGIENRTSFKFDCSTLDENDGHRFWNISIWPLMMPDGHHQAIVMAAESTQQVEIEIQREQFIATLAHDLMAPLVGVQHIVSNLVNQDGRSGIDSRKLLLLIDAATGDLLHMVSSLLDVYRLESGQERFHFISQNVAEFIRESLEELQPISARAQVVIVRQIADPLFAEVDRLAIKRICTTLIFNSLKSTPAGGQVFLTAQSDKANIIIELRDSGEGIAAADLPKLFQRFWKPDGAKMYSTGTALGLYLCRELVEAHKGTISCTSISGRGKTFRISIPRFIGS